VVEGLVEARLGYSLGVGGLQALGTFIPHLRGRERGLEGNDGLALRARDRIRSLRVALRRPVRLVCKIEVDRRETLAALGCDVALFGSAEGLAAVPHVGAEELQVRRRKWTAQDRQLLGGRKVI